MASGAWTKDPSDMDSSVKNYLASLPKRSDFSLPNPMCQGDAVIEVKRCLQHRELNRILLLLWHDKLCVPRTVFANTGKGSLQSLL